MTDTSFVGTPDLAAKIADVKAALDCMGQDVQVGVGWDWHAALPAAAKPPWRFLTLSARPPLGAEELAEQLAATRGAKAARWVALAALPKEGHTSEERADDLSAACWRRKSTAPRRSSAPTCSIPDAG